MTDIRTQRDYDRQFRSFTRSLAKPPLWARLFAGVVGFGVCALTLGLITLGLVSVVRGIVGL